MLWLPDILLRLQQNQVRVFEVANDRIEKTGCLCAIHHPVIE
jgi:hypothetical protein